MAWYVVWPDGHGMVYGMVWWAWHEKDMAWQAWHSIRYGLMMHGIAWCMVWPGRPRMLYSMALRASHGLWYGLAGISWYMVLAWWARQGLGIV